MTCSTCGKKTHPWDDEYGYMDGNQPTCQKCAIPKNEMTEPDEANRRCSTCENPVRRDTPLYDVEDASECSACFNYRLAGAYEKDANAKTRIKHKYDIIRAWDRWMKFSKGHILSLICVLVMVFGATLARFLPFVVAPVSIFETCFVFLSLLYWIESNWDDSKIIMKSMLSVDATKWILIGVISVLYGWLLFGWFLSRFDELPIISVVGTFYTFMASFSALTFASCRTAITGEFTYLCPDIPNQSIVHFVWDKLRASKSYD